MLLKEYKIERPKTTKIQKKKGISYVYQVVSSTYDATRKFNVDKRVCIGKMIDEIYMIPNERFIEYYPDISMNEVELPSFSDTLKIGSFILIHKIMEELKLVELLDDVFEEGAMIVDLVSYILVSESCCFQYYPNFMRNHPIYSDKIISDSSISKLLKSKINEEDIQVFLNAWNKIQANKNCVYISYDSTNMNTTSEGIELAEFGHPKVNEELPQVNLSYAINHEDGVPMFYELYAGSIVDIAQCKYMAEKARDYGYRNIGVILDRGYYSKQNVLSLKRNGYDYLMMVKINLEPVQKALSEVSIKLRNMASCYIAEHGVCGMTVKSKLFSDDKEDSYFHIYYDDGKASEQKKALLDMLNKLEIELQKKIEKRIAIEGELKKFKNYFKLKYDANKYLVGYSRDNEKIETILKSYGFFCIITSEEIDAFSALDIYRNRDNVEKTFRGLKSGIDYDKFRVHSTEALQAKTFITFLAMIVRNEIFQKTKELRRTNRKDYTIPAILSELENIECTKNNLKKYVRNYALTAKMKRMLKQFEIDEKYIDGKVRGLNL